MNTPSQYRAQAAERVRCAENAKNAAHRTALLKQAETLLRMADEAAMMQQILEMQENSTRETPAA
jgi:hypothetical protein